MSHLSLESDPLKKLALDKLVNAVICLYDNKAAGEMMTSQVTASGSPPTAGYNASSTDDIFDEHIMFRDPLMRTTGLAAYKAQFASLHQLFPDITMEILSVTTGVGRGTIRLPRDVQEESRGEKVTAGTKGRTGAVATSSSSTTNSSSVSNVSIPGSLASMASCESLNRKPDDSPIVIIDSIATYKTKWISLPIRQITNLRLNTEGKIVTHEDMWSLADIWDRLPLIGWLYRVAQPAIGKMFSWALLRTYAYRANTPFLGLDHPEAVLATHTVHAAYHPIESQRIGWQKGESARQKAIPTAEKIVGGGDSPKPSSGADDGEHASTGKGGARQRGTNEKKSSGSRTTSGERKSH